MTRARWSSWLAFSVASVIGTMVVSPSAIAEKKAGSADGDSCDIPLPGGTKEPGKVKGLECCSVLDPKKCVIILKPFPGSKAMAVKNTGAIAATTAPKATPTPPKTKAPVGLSRDVAPARTPTP